MLTKFETVLGGLFLLATAFALAFPKCSPLSLVFLSLVIVGTPFVIRDFAKNLYTAFKAGYVVPDEREGPAYRTESPVTFWSNVLLSIVFIPIIIGGAIVIVREVFLGISAAL